MKLERLRQFIRFFDIEEQSDVCLALGVLLIVTGGAGLFFTPNSCATIISIIGIAIPIMLIMIGIMILVSLFFK